MHDKIETFKKTAALNLMEMKKGKAFKIAIDVKLQNCDKK